MPDRAFRPLLRWALAAGQDQGSLVESLRSLAPMYRKRGAFQAEKLQIFLPTLLMLVIGGSATLALRPDAVRSAVDHARRPGLPMSGRAGASLTRILQCRMLQSKYEAKGTLTAEETARLSEQIAGLVKAGLAAGARAAGARPGGSPRQAADLAARAGRSRSTGASRWSRPSTDQKDRIPPHLRGLVLGGIRSGRLGDVLGRFTGYMSIGTELKRKLWLSLAYPILSIVVALALFLFVNLVVVVMFETIFRDFGIPLPRMTIAMLMFSHVLRAGLPVLRDPGDRPAGHLWIVIRLFAQAGRSAGAWPPGSRSWAASGGRSRGPSSPTCWHSCSRAGCRCPRPSG